jgi:hypothetical protein
MMKPSLFAAQEHEAKLSKLGDALEVMERHVDFAALAAAVDDAASTEPCPWRPSAVSDGGDGADPFGSATVQRLRRADWSFSC